jgi:hypothetical protein
MEGCLDTVNHMSMPVPKGGAKVSAFQNRRKLWVYRMEKLSGCAPLDFKMARYIEKLNIRSPEQLKYALEHNQQVVFVGFKAMNKLRELAGLPQVQRKYSWKDEAKRLYALLDKAGLEYDKQK